MRRPTLLIAALSSLISAANAEPTGFNLASEYAQNLWPTAHRDQSNSDYAPVVMSQATRVSKHLLSGHPLFWPPTTGPEGNLYVSSGKGAGHSNLHAFNQRGELLWQTPAQQGLDDVDGVAMINAPVVDSTGIVYQGDQNQLWAFRPDGSVKWVTDIAALGADMGFMSVILAPGNLVCGISNNGKVMVFDAETGKLARPVLDLPGGTGPAAEDSPPDSLWRELMDPAIKPYMFNLIQGWEMEVANTPSIHPQTGRIFITAYGVEADSGLLYGIDIGEDELQIAFQTDMGKGSGTSPAISHDGKRVYALDEKGRLVAVDTQSGAKLWTAKDRGGSAASPSVGPDESIYSPNKDYLLALNPDGSRKFKHSYDDFCSDEINPPRGLWKLVFSEPVAFIDSIVTVDANNAGWLNIVCGYHIKWLPSRSERTLTPIPIRSLIVAVSLEDGRPVSLPLAIPETSEGFITPVANGNQFVSLSGALTSIFYHGLNPILPERFEVKNRPQAGLLLLEPIDRLSLAEDGIDWLSDQLLNARKQVASRPASASAALKATTSQFFSSQATVAETRLGTEALQQATVLVAEAIYLLQQQLPDKAERNLELAVAQLERQKTMIVNTRKNLEGTPR